MKKYCNLVLIVLSTLYSLNIRAYDYCIDNIFYNRISASELAVTSEYECYISEHMRSFRGTDSYKDIISIPESVTIEGAKYTVKSIGKGAFASSPNLITVNIPNTITVIEEYAFQSCRGLKEIDIPDNVTNIERGAFYGCDSLEIVKLGCPAITSSDIFMACVNLKTITFTANVREIQGLFFSGLKSLTSIYSLNTIPPAVVINFNYQANPDCVIYVPKGCVEMYKSDRFWRLFSSIQEVNLSGESTDQPSQNQDTTYPGVEFIKYDGYIYGIKTDDKGRVDNIWYNLDTKNKVAEVTQGKTVYKGDLTIPSKVTYNNIEYDVICIGYDAFHESDITSLKLPNTILYVCADAFYGCSSMKSIDLGNSLLYIGSNAFQKCYQLSSIKIPDSVTKIGCAAFTHCRSLCSISIPNKVEIIEGTTFNDCEKLETLSFGTNVKKMEEYIIAQCPSLLDVYCYAQELPQVVYDTFYYADLQFVTLHVPTSLVDKYKRTAPWNSFMSIIPLTNTGINKVEDGQTVDRIITLDGKTPNSPQKGINIIRMNDGTTKKVIKK